MLPRRLYPTYTPLSTTTPDCKIALGPGPPPRTHTTSTYPTQASIPMCNLKVNNTTEPQLVQPRALTLMVTAGQWQAVKDTLSRPIGRNLTTSDTLVI